MFCSCPTVIVYKHLLVGDLPHGGDGCTRGSSRSPEASVGPLGLESAAGDRER